MHNTIFDRGYKNRRNSRTKSKFYKFRNNSDSRHKCQLTCFNCLRSNCKTIGCPIDKITEPIKIEVAAYEFANEVPDRPMSSAVLLVQKLEHFPGQINEDLMIEDLVSFHQFPVAQPNKKDGKDDHHKKGDEVKLLFHDVLFNNKVTT